MAIGGHNAGAGDSSSVPSAEAGLPHCSIAFRGSAAKRVGDAPVSAKIPYESAKTKLALDGAIGSAGLPGDLSAMVQAYGWVTGAGFADAHLRRWSLIRGRRPPLGVGAVGVEVGVSTESGPARRRRNVLAISVKDGRAS